VRARSLAAGLYLRVHWRLPGAVGHEHTNAHDLATQTVTLPLYPELSDRDRELLVRLLGAPRRSIERR
jgi:dTDP-4-amino-4,6-dideoxygalactose transaminase